METTTTTASHTKSSTKNKGIEAVEEQVENVQHAIEERVVQASDIVEDLRDRAELALHERPYLLPVAAGALGLGIGVLIGSKLSRMIVLGAAGALLNDTIRTQIVKMGKEIISNLSEKLDETEEDLDEPSSV